MNQKPISKPFNSAKTEVESHLKFQKENPDYDVYQLAFTDQTFLLRPELRPVRFQLELLKPELTLNDHHINRTIAFFGSARIHSPEQAKEHTETLESQLEKDPNNQTLAYHLRIAKRLQANSRYYLEARKLARLISSFSRQAEEKLVVVTGGGPGIMEAANRGAHDAGELSVSLNIVLPKEPEPNPYVAKELNFLFHYFALRKMHFLMRAQAMIAFPGGFGTFDELFETLTLVQTEKIKPIPVLLFGQEFWNKVVSFEALIEEGVISPENLGLFHFVETAEEAWELIQRSCDL